MVRKAVASFVYIILNVPGATGMADRSDIRMGDNRMSPFERYTRER